MAGEAKGASKVTKLPKEKVAKDVAEDEFERFAEDWELDTDVDDMDDEEAAQFRSLKRSIVRAIRKGTLVVNDDVSVTCSLARSGLEHFDSITLRPPNAGAALEADQYRTGQGLHKAYAYIAAMADEKTFQAATVAKVDSRDLKPIMAVTQAFLAS